MQRQAAHGSVPLGTVLACDADTDFRLKAAAALSLSGFDVIEVKSGEQALQAARARRPAAVVLDVDLPELCGYEVCWILRSEYGPDLPILFVSADRTEPRDRVAGLLLGADDYLVKPCDPGELVARIIGLLRRTRRPDAAGSIKLTRRELDVLRGLAEGYDRDQIADQLVISARTVNSHLENIFKKLGVHNQAQAVAFAYRAGLVGGPT